MSQTEKESFGASGGLAAEVMVEAGTDLGLVEVKARGYWEQVWRRFRRDKVAIAGGIFIILLVFVAFVGGSLAGYYRGWVDTIISRVTEITMAFPALLFIIALASTVGTRLNDITFGIFGKGVVTLVLVFAVFGWFYPARIIRAVVLSLREK